MRLRIDLSYDGTDFHGWAKQPGLRSVEQDLENALNTVLRRPGHRLTVAGRTDAGVHARAQVAHVDLAHDALDERALQLLRRRLNGVLEPDVRIRRVSEAPAGFDARFSAIWRRYCYRVVDRPEYVDPLTRGHVLTRTRPLDEDRMNRAAELLVGMRDFASFCKRREGATTIRSLHHLGWERRVDGVLEATVRADAFCHNMVRSLIGCLIAVGEGRHEPGWAGQVLHDRQRHPGVTVVHAHGLTLEEVAYPPDDELARQARDARSLRTLPDSAGWGHEL